MAGPSLTVRAFVVFACGCRWTITPTKFSNQYYKMLTKFEWTEKAWPGEPDRPLQYKNEGQPASSMTLLPASWRTDMSPSCNCSLTAPDLGEELMMLPTDLALVQDDAFRPHVEAYAADKDLFFADFAKVSNSHEPVLIVFSLLTRQFRVVAPCEQAFAKLIELGVDRTQAYKAAPKKADEPARPDKGQSFGKAKL